MPYISKAMRMAVWDKYIGINIGQTNCFVCRTIKISQFSFECGHIIAHSKGGKILLENLRPICSSCNKAIGNKNMFKFITQHGPYKNAFKRRIKQEDDDEIIDLTVNDN